MLRCTIFAQVSKKYGTQKDNVQIVKKSGGEKVEAYIRRISSTFCGSHVHGSKGQKKTKGGWGGGLPNSQLDKYLKAKKKCVDATAAHKAKVKECKRKVRQYNAEKAKCNLYQEQMDAKACRSAVLTKDQGPTQPIVPKQGNSNLNNQYITTCVPMVSTY